MQERDNTGAMPAHYAAQADNCELLATIHQCQKRPGESDDDEEGDGAAGDDASARPPDEPLPVEVLQGRMNNGNTPAHVAALFDSPAALDFLHRVGCDLELTCRDGETPLIKAARAQAVRAYKFLLENGTRGADVDVRNCENDNARALVADNMRFWRMPGGATVKYTR